MYFCIRGKSHLNAVLSALWAGGLRRAVALIPENKELAAFSGRRNCDSPTPSPACGRGGGRVTIPTRGYTVALLVIYVLCAWEDKLVKRYNAARIKTEMKCRKGDGNLLQNKQSYFLLYRAFSQLTQADSHLAKLFLTSPSCFSDAYLGTHQVVSHHTRLFTRHLIKLFLNLSSCFHLVKLFLTLVNCFSKHQAVFHPASCF